MAEVSALITDSAAMASGTTNGRSPDLAARLLNHGSGHVDHFQPFILSHFHYVMKT